MQYIAANSMILDLVIEIGVQKSVLTQLLKIENVDMAQKSQINAFVAVCSRYFKYVQCGAIGTVLRSLQETCLTL